MTEPLTDQQLAAASREVADRMFAGLMPGATGSNMAAEVAEKVAAPYAAEVTRLRAELEQARAQVRAVEQVRCWTNEDGKRFAFADDLYAALVGPCRAEPTAPARA